jgi:hypothetical protein
MVDHLPCLGQTAEEMFVEALHRARDWPIDCYHALGLCPLARVSRNFAISETHVLKTLEIGAQITEYEASRRSSLAWVTLWHR